MRDHSRAVARRLNGVHAGQEFWFSFKRPDVFPGRHRGLNALGEAFARLPGVSTISIPRRAPLFPHIAEPVIGRAFARPGGSCGLLADLGRRPPHFRKAPPAADLHKRAGPGARPFEDANGTSERGVEPGSAAIGRWASTLK